jgi:hypothetical protein
MARTVSRMIFGSRIPDGETLASEVIGSCDGSPLITR